jgi:hypothetical protein
MMRQQQSDSNSISATHEWRRMQDFIPGDFIHRWGDDLEVLNVRGGINECTITYKDGEEVKEISDLYDKQYIARKRPEEQS